MNAFDEQADMSNATPVECPRQELARLDAVLEQAGLPPGPAKTPIRDEATSKHLSGTVELTVIADLKPGLINVRETMTYATRLRMLLRTLGALRKERTERADKSIFVGPIDRLQTIHNVSWTIIDDDRKMLMTVVFDQALEPYIRKLVGDGAPVLNAILCHCVGYEGDKGYAAFTDFVRRHQAPVETMAATVSGQTIDDQRYLKELERLHRTEPYAHARDMAAAKLRVKDAFDPDMALDDKEAERNAVRALKTIGYMQRLDEFFPEPEAAAESAEDGRRDRDFLHTLVRSMLEGFRPGWVREFDLQKRFKQELNWFKDVVGVKSEKDRCQLSRWNFESARPPENKIQGHILSEYKNKTHGCLLLFRLSGPDSARCFLKSLQPKVTTGESEDSETTLNIAMTYNGLKTLGLADEELVKFPKEFREGMQARASLLGDIGTNHPSNWNLPRANWPPPRADEEVGTVALSTVDLVVQLQKADNEPCAEDWLWCEQHPLYKDVADWAKEVETTGGQLLSVEPLRRKLIDGNVHEHFGFRDGLSQPKPAAAQGDPNRVALGEVLLGHANDHEEPDAEQRDPLLLNGSFMVIRKLAQDVQAFEEFLDSNKQVMNPADLQAKMMGRRANGAPITIAEPEKYDFKNDFDYKDDADGLRCPLHAHIRRANPRDAQEKGEPVPRIMRRGFSYGPRYKEQPDADRGLMFMAYNASIAQQFEVIQRWLSGGNSTGVMSTHSDPLLGVAAPGDERTMSFIDDGKVKRFKLGEKPFVKLEWGMYMFVPSIDALQKLSENDASSKPYPQANVQRGVELLKKFRLADSVESTDNAKLRWKKLLEDRSARRYAEDVWAAIRAQGGALRTPYGVLVADEQLIMEALRDEGEVYSVREYCSRFKDTTGLVHLGIDAKPQAINAASQPGAGAGKCPHHESDPYVSAMTSGEHREVSRYQRESTSINQWIADFCPHQAFIQTREETDAWLGSHLIKAGEQRGNVKMHGDIKLKQLVKDVLGKLAVRWFGLPDDGSVQVGGARGAKPHCPEDFLMVSSYVFYPNPTPFVKAKARERGQAMQAAIKKYVCNAIDEQTLPENTLLSQLYAEGKATDDIVRNIGGVAGGFVSPTTGSMLGALYTLITSEDFWRHQQAYLQRHSHPSDGFRHAESVLKAPLIRAMQERPAPPLPHRTAVKEFECGGVDIRPGDRVVLGVVSAALQQLERPVTNEADATRLLFGGNYAERDGEKRPLATAHACPGQGMAFAAMLGILSSLFELEGTLESAGALTLSLNE